MLSSAPQQLAKTETAHRKSGGGLSETGDRSELVGDKQRDQISKLLSAQFDFAAVVIYERDSPVLPAVAVDHDLRDRMVRNVVGRYRRRLSGLGPRQLVPRRTGRRPDWFDYVVSRSH
jgi:hypothetical protein